jgi:hypothetical protein
MFSLAESPAGSVDALATNRNSSLRDSKTSGLDEERRLIWPGVSRFRNFPTRGPSKFDLGGLVDFHLWGMNAVVMWNDQRQVLTQRALRSGVHPKRRQSVQRQPFFPVNDN